MFATLARLAPTSCVYLPRWSHFRNAQHRPDSQNINEDDVPKQCMENTHVLNRSIWICGIDHEIDSTRYSVGR
jgi:hypothetical protein